MREPEQQQKQRQYSVATPSGFDHAFGRAVKKQGKQEVRFSLLWGWVCLVFRVGRLRRLFGWRGGGICCGVWVCNCLCCVVFCRERARNWASWGSCGRVFSRSPWFVRG